jgi:hypothetical protein
MQSGVDVMNIFEYLSREQRKKFGDFIRHKEQERTDALQARINQRLEVVGDNHARLARVQLSTNNSYIIILTGSQ